MSQFYEAIVGALARESSRNAEALGRGFSPETGVHDSGRSADGRRTCTCKESAATKRHAHNTRGTRLAHSAYGTGTELSEVARYKVK